MYNGLSQVFFVPNQKEESISILRVNSIYFLVSGAERVLHLRLEMPGELPPLIIEMLDRTENVCIP